MHAKYWPRARSRGFMPLGGGIAVAFLCQLKAGNEKAGKASCVVNIPNTMGSGLEQSQISKFSKKNIHG